jgi:hypothetical protein
VGGVLMARAGVNAFFVAIAGILGLSVIAILFLRRHITPTIALGAPPSTSIYRRMQTRLRFGRGKAASSRSHTGPGHPC